MRDNVFVCQRYWKYSATAVQAQRTSTFPSIDGLRPLLKNIFVFAKSSSTWQSSLRESGQDGGVRYGGGFHA